MFYFLARHYLPWFEAHGMGFVRVFTFVIFQTTVATLVSFLAVLWWGERVIAWLRRQKIGDTAGFDEAKMDELMKTKKGTPTMGGILIIGAIALSTLLLADLSNFYVQMALVCLVWLGAVGAVDDWLKLTVGRRQGSRQGLTSLEKLLFQIGLAALLGFFTFQWGRALPETHTFYVPFFKPESFSLVIGLGGFIAVTILVITGASNAVNLTDGLDGLAAGTMAITSFAFLVLALIIGDLALSKTLLYHHIRAADQMAVLAGAMLGACLGFLWFNCNPARIFMGDTGSLALGGLIGYIAIVIRQELMLFIIGGIFVAEAVSVLIQVGYFKYSRRRFGAGRRVFLMAPLHHHFQKKGWGETQVVVRFWLIGAMLAAMAIATIKLR